LTQNDIVKKEQLQSKVNEQMTQIDIMEENLRFAFFDDVKQKKKKKKKRASPK